MLFDNIQSYDSNDVTLGMARPYFSFSTNYFIK